MCDDGRRCLGAEGVHYLVELGLGVRGPERVTGAWGAAARRRAHLRA